MVNNMIKILIRQMRRHKSHSFINISCLVVGLSCSILMILWVHDEYSYDRFHKNFNTLYRVISEKKTPGKTFQEAGAPAALAKTLKENYPEIINSTRYIGVPEGWLIQYEEKSFLNDRLGSADPSFFEMFTFPFIQGDPKTALDEPYSMVITIQMAQKYFGNDDPLGQIIKIHGNGFKVTGVLKAVPGNSHLQFDFILPMSFWKEAWGLDLDSWKGSPYHTYIQLEEECYADQVNSKISSIVKINNPDVDWSIYLQSLNKVHLNSHFRNDLWGHGSITTVYIFICTASCILLIACINFMNLSTAQSANRAREIGMRKVTGAQRNDILIQFLSESISIAFISLFIAMGLVYLVLPTFNRFTGKALSIMDFGHMDVFIGFIIVTLLAGIIAGSYPAIFLSSFQPVEVLRGVFVKKSRGQFCIRKVLVVFQFAVTTIFISMSIIIYSQLKYIHTKDLGFQREHIIYFLARGGFGRNYEAARSSLLESPNIISVSKSFPPFGSRTENGTSDIRWEGKDAIQKILMQPVSVDYDYLETFAMEMKKGRFFSREWATDRSNYILNEAAVRAMDIESPIGKRFSHQDRDGTIIGIIKDFHQHSLHNEIIPLFLEFDENNMYVCVRIDPKKIPETIQFLEKKWNEFVPGFPFTYDFLGDTINSAYTTEKQVGNILRYFTIIAVGVACMGLFGLASFNTAQRTKEIGIRKVLGAPVSGILLMLSKEFTKCVLISNIVAWPIAYFIMRRWLLKFAFKVDLNWYIFIVSGVISLGIAMLTVSYQVIRSVKSNPVESLKYE